MRHPTRLPHIRTLIHILNRAIGRATCASPLLTAKPFGFTWPRSSIDGWRNCWAGMSFPLWEALYRRRHSLHPAVGNARPRPRLRRRRRRRRRLHGSLRPQRPLHPKMLHRKTGRLHARASAVGPWTPATLPSLASVLGPSPRHQRRWPSSVTTARASATPPVPVRTCQSAHSAVGHTGATSALRNALRASRPSTTATCVKRTATD